MQQLEQQLESTEVSAKTTTVLPAKPWGFWATIGFGAILFLVWSTVREFASVTISGGSFFTSPGELPVNSRADAWADVVALPVILGGIILLAWARRGISVSSYLGLTWPRVRQVVSWFLAVAAFEVGFELLSALLHRPQNEYVLNLVRTSGWLPLFLGVAVAAPLGEEFFFRGFLYSGLSKSRGGPALAIVLPALVFGAIHNQYDYYGMLNCLAMALLFGFMRWRTGSLWLCVVLHGMMNARTMIEVAFKLSK